MLQNKTFQSWAIYLGANAAGLLLAAILLPGFNMTITGFILAVGIFSLVQTIASPMINSWSKGHAPQLMGGISIIVIIIGLIVTPLIVSGMRVGGIANLLAATLLVWIGSLVAEMVLRKTVFNPNKPAHPAKAAAAPEQPKPQPAPQPEAPQAAPKAEGDAPKPTAPNSDN